MTTVQTVCGLELLAARAVLVETLGCVPSTRACVPNAQGKANRSYCKVI